MAAGPEPQTPSPNSPIGALPTILTVEQLAAFLGVNKKTLYEEIKKGKVKGVRHVGGTIRVLRDAVLNWLAEGQGRVSRSSRRPK